MYPPEEEEDNPEPEDESEVILEKVEEEMQEIFDQDEDEDEENIMHLDDLADLTKNIVSFTTDKYAHLGVKISQEYLSRFCEFIVSRHDSILSFLNKNNSPS